jgi:16S rRNA (cytosine967-C5)-methyltransferase
MGLLRGVLRAHESGETLELSADPAIQLAQQASLPDWLAASLIQWRGPEGAAAVAAACNHVPDLDLRVNRLRSTLEQVGRDLGGGRNRNASDCRLREWVAGVGPQR